MLTKEKKGTTSSFANAVLSKDILIVMPTGFSLSLQKGESILVDIKEGIAFAEGFHFDVSCDEFSITLKEQSHSLNAVATKEINFNCTIGNVIVIPSGSLLNVDPNESIGYYNGHHFDISDDEFSVVA